MVRRLIDYSQAAEMCGVDEPTVRQWRSRRYLTPVGRYGRRLLFWVADVVAADEKARNEPAGRRRKSEGDDERMRA